MRYNISLSSLNIAIAFDHGCHRGLLKKLHAEGICGCLLKVIKIFLSDLLLWVVNNGSVSHECSVEARIPKGSVLRPALSPIYKN